MFLKDEDTRRKLLEEGHILKNGIQSCSQYGNHGVAVYCQLGFLEDRWLFLVAVPLVIFFFGISWFLPIGVFFNIPSHFLFRKPVLSNEE